MSSDGITPSEQYLTRTARRSFLRMWSISNPYRDQCKQSGSSDGKEICDLLVVFDKHIIIFSDKRCEFQDISDIELAWKRWSRNAILGSKRELLGAARWIRNYSDRLFYDKKCTRRIDLPINPCDAEIHLVAVASGAEAKCKQHFETSIRGSLILHGGTASMDADPLGQLFTVGDINPNGEYVHVLSEANLELILSELDTISDFVSYLCHKVEVLRSLPLVRADGEEDFLSLYMRSRQLPNGLFGIASSYDTMYVQEGCWDEYINHPQYVQKCIEDQYSYLWDSLIDRFTDHAIEGTLEFKPEDPSGTEQSLRIMASESRFSRRLLSKALAEIVLEAPEDRLSIRNVKSWCIPDVYYVFIAWREWPGCPPEQQRTFRQIYLEKYCLSFAMTMADQSLRIVGLATDAGPDEYKSEDLLLLKDIEWTPDLVAQIHEDRKLFEWHRKVDYKRFHESEYPDVAQGKYLKQTPAIDGRRSGKKQANPKRFKIRKNRKSR